MKVAISSSTASLSDHPFVQEHRDVIHKIGVTSGDIARRIAGAKLDPTFLMADVEVVATYELSNINRVRLEKLIHKFFEPARGYAVAYCTDVNSGAYY